MSVGVRFFDVRAGTLVEVDKEVGPDLGDGFVSRERRNVEGYVTGIGGCFGGKIKFEPANT